MCPEVRLEVKIEVTLKCSVCNVNISYLSPYLNKRSKECIPIEIIDTL